MSTVVRHSEIWPLEADSSAPSDDCAPGREPTLWLDGDVIGCSCPDCGAPMSVRLWLRLADCWCCGTSIELTEEQEREVQRLLAEREAQLASEVTPAPLEQPQQTPARGAQPSKMPATSAVVAPAAKRLHKPQPKPAPQVVDPLRPRVAAPPIADQQVERAPLSWTALAAWLASLLVHMLLIILLGLWMFHRPRHEPMVSLISGFGPAEAEGEQEEFEQVSLPFEQPDPGDLQAEAVVDDDPFGGGPTEIARLDENPFGAGPDLADLPQEIYAPGGKGSILRGRGTRERAELVKSAGGNRYTEEAVARGLRWLAEHQHEDGRWGLHDYHRAGDCNGRCGQTGQRCDIAATAIALLPFLGAGQTHKSGEYRRQVREGLDWLVDQQQRDGDLRGNGIGRMYAHALATIVLCESFALTQDRELREPAQRAVDFIVEAQHGAGGWRYHPKEPGDTSVVGWQVMALRSAEMAYLKVPAKTLTKTDRYLNSAQRDSEGGLYGYMPGFPATPAMTAEALLCRQYAGWPRKHPGMKAGVEYLLTRLPSTNQMKIYDWYYATQVMHHYGGDAWYAWNQAMRETLLELQATDGHEAGSWAPGDDHMAAGGRLATTSLAICTLEVYYRHLPLYKEQAAKR